MFCSTKVSGCSAAVRMSLSSQKWKMMSWPGTVSSTFCRSRTSASMNRKPGCCQTLARFAVRPVFKLSNTVTAAPSCDQPLGQVAADETGASEKNNFLVL